MLTHHLKKSWILNTSALLVCLLISCTFVTAQAQETNSNPVVADFLNVYNTATGKVAQLANEIPDDTYDWRPSEGIRSIREAVLHLTSANYFFASQLEVEIPEGINPQAMEQSGMNKEEAITALKESVAFVQETVTNMTEEDFNAKVNFFGNEVTKRQIMFTLGDHAAEHLGQLIAYARMNNIAPPWSQ